MSAPRLRVVIPHRNGEELLRACLTSLLPALRQGEDHVCVVDNASTDTSRAMVAREFPTVEVLALPWNRGFARAVNAGLVGPEPLILILNNDVQVDGSVLHHLVELMRQHPDVGLLAPRLVGADGTPQRSFGYHPRPFTEAFGGGRRPSKALPDDRDVVPVETVVGACMVARRTAIDAVGPLDTDFFFYYEETEWCHRMAKGGYVVAVAPRLQVRHGRGVSTRPLRREARLEMTRSRALYHLKVFPRSVAWGIQCILMLRLLVNTLFALLLVVITVGLSRRAREEAATRCALVAFRLQGMPPHAGLPGKEPS